MEFLRTAPSGMWSKNVDNIIDIKSAFVATVSLQPNPSSMATKCKTLY